MTTGVFVVILLTVAVRTAEAVQGCESTPGGVASRSRHDVISRHGRRECVEHGDAAERAAACPCARRWRRIRGLPRALERAQRMVRARAAGPLQGSATSTASVASLRSRWPIWGVTMRRPQRSRWPECAEPRAASPRVQHVRGDHGFTSPLRSAPTSRRSAHTSSRINLVWASPSPLRSCATCACIALTTTAMKRFNTMNVATSR